MFSLRRRSVAYALCLAAFAYYLHSKSKASFSLLVSSQHQQAPAWYIDTNASLVEVTCIGSEIDSHLSLEKKCVYASKTFWHGRGLSIFTTPDVKDHLETLKGFTDPAMHLAPRKSFPHVIERKDSLFNNRIPQDDAFPYYVAPLPGKGLSVLASRRIEAGTQILIEHPVILSQFIPPEEYRDDTAELWPRLNGTLLDALPEGAKNEVRRLSGAVDPRSGKGDGALVSRVLATNSFRVDLVGKEHAALFPMVSRMNHDCRPNVAYAFSTTRLTMSLRAVRSISEHEELTISYIPSDRFVTSERKERLRAWGFECACSLCSGEEWIQSESDERVRRLNGVRRSLEALWKVVKEREKNGEEIDNNHNHGIDFEEINSRVEYLLTLLKIERSDQSISGVYLLAARLLSRASTTTTSCLDHSAQSQKHSPSTPPLTPTQIHKIFTYLSLATASGLNAYGKSWGASYNDALRIERRLEGMLLRWEELEARSTTEHTKS